MRLAEAVRLASRGNDSENDLVLELSGAAGWAGAPATIEEVNRNDTGDGLAPRVRSNLEVTVQGSPRPTTNEFLRPDKGKPPRAILESSGFAPATREQSWKKNGIWDLGRARSDDGPAGEGQAGPTSSSAPSAVGSE